MNKPLTICFDGSATPTLRRMLTERASLFVPGDAAAADVVLFGTDDIGYIDESPLFKAFGAKSMCVTESDIPTFRLPGFYAANEASALTAKRTETMSYFLSENDRPNPAIQALVGQRLDKRYLYSFMGAANSWPRKRLLKSIESRSDTLIESTHGYNHWTDEASAEDQRRAQRQRYAQVMASSKFALCPRGCGLSSYRLFESMRIGVAPVIISDRWRPIAGIDWSFALFLRERQIPAMDSILRHHQDEWAERGRMAAAAYHGRLEPSRVPDMIYEQIIRLLADYSPLREHLTTAAVRLRSARRTACWKAYGVGKHLLLASFQLTGIACPIPLMQPADQQLRRMRAKR